jgi:hypothetical protein
MSAQEIERTRLGKLTKIGQAHGVAYAAPNVKTKSAAFMVYKEYKIQALAGIDFTVLAAMPALVEDTLSYKEAERLIALAAWPHAVDCSRETFDGDRTLVAVRPAPRRGHGSLSGLGGWR